MLKSQKGIIFLAVLILLVVYILIRPSFQMNGNNEKNIVKTIHSIDGYENKDAIEILKIFDSNHGHDRTVAFLYDNSPAYIHFYKNKDGNYKWTYAASKRGSTDELFFVKIGKVMHSDHVLVVTNADTSVAKIKLTVIGESTKEFVLILHPKSASFIKLENIPKPLNGHEYRFEYEYFDKDGKQIK
ncbi:hypothetical protein CN692_00480 [Bacillus sp. AFS002410]|uniref:hypothetical protein n=1 Tax=Bacillus sp. AFS002410 TaxID=2033481 RepID=UPI000BF1EAAA|nr:hypothetical protein [Bacillus sp. AFS002410]PEJ60600.1 hypothetical protein CN692_00480 [Bacillus sp. AFS002410]